MNYFCALQHLSSRRVKMLAPKVAIVVSLLCFTVMGEESKPTPIVSTTSNPTQLPSTPSIAQGNAARPTNPEWAAGLERLRIQPRAGEVVNGTVSAYITDVISGKPDVREKTMAIAREYDRVLLEKAVKWEAELRELRAQYDAKIIAELPEPRREQTQKFLDLSRAGWTEATSRDFKIRFEF